MNEAMRAGMLKATRLIRARGLLEATVTIQRTLRSIVAPHAAADSPGPTTDGSIEGTFRVIDADSVASPGSADVRQRPVHGPSTRFRAPRRPHFWGSRAVHTVPRAAASALLGKLRAGIPARPRSRPSMRRGARGAVPHRVLHQSGGNSRLQAVHSQWLPWADAALSRYAPWLYADPRRFRRRHRHECARRRTPVLRGVSCPGACRQWVEMLELVQCG